MPNPTVVFPEPETVELQDRDRPTPGPDEVLIETDTTVISTGTELTVLSGGYPDQSVWDTYGEYPFVAGYANVGTVVEAGEEAHIETGTRVTSWTPHAAYVTARADDCTPVPGDVSDAEAALFVIAQIVMNGIRRGRVTWGETAVVYGAGLLGQFAVRLCRLAGAETVVGVDLAADRLDFLPDDPGVLAANPDDEIPAKAVQTVSNGRFADVCFEVTGNPDAIPDEFEVLRDQGRLVLLSSPHGETTLDFHDYVNAPSTEIIGAHQLSHPSTATAADPWTKRRHADLYFSYLRQNRLAVEALFTHAVEPADAPGLYRDLLDDRTQAMAARIEW
jgi:2-desacetyl-2-hydroxyethyl bacteriochlorophyllide A dehydrogenase